MSALPKHRSSRFDRNEPWWNGPSFSRFEFSRAHGPHIEASVERVSNLREQGYEGRFNIDLQGADSSGFFNFTGQADAQWLREAAGVLLDCADAVDEANAEAYEIRRKAEQ